MEKEMVSDRHKSIRAIAMFSTREILLAADVNLFMPTVILLEFSPSMVVRFYISSIPHVT